MKVTSSPMSEKSVRSFQFFLTLIFAYSTSLHQPQGLAAEPVVVASLEGAAPTEVANLRESDFRDPAREYGVRCWWWWLNGNVTKAAITKDLEAMHKKGFSGAMIFDADGSGQKGNERAPEGPMFGSDQWTELYLHALQEAKRLGLKLGLSIQSGWNLGGPRVTPEDAAKEITWSKFEIDGPQKISQQLPEPDHRFGYYRDIRVLAWPVPTPVASRKPIRDLSDKTAAHELGGSAPDCRYLLDDFPSREGEHDVLLNEVVDLTGKLSETGVLTWEVPAGRWIVLRMGYTPTDAKVSTSSGRWQGHVIDYLSEAAFDNYWYDSVEPLLQKAGPMVGSVLTHLETDSWECHGMNWTPHFEEEFKRFNGYDLACYLPVIAGKIVESREVSNAFLADFRKTIGHCISENHYGRFAARAAEHGLGTQPECSGPHAGPLDGIKNYAHSDIVMSEFWAPSPHRPDPADRFFVKQASSAAHIYGKRFVGAESFTTIGPHWNDLLWRGQKSAMDYEFCAGLNMIFFHTFTCSPQEMGYPGQEYFAGTHVNPQVTWWDESQPFMDYINRIQYMTQQGRFVADVLYYYGDHVPNIAQHKGSDPAGALPGYDYDVTNEDVLLQLEVADGHLIAPGGTSYRLLVLPDHKVLSLAALRKVDSLLREGATILGPKPQRLVSRVGGNLAQREFSSLANRIWGEEPAERGTRKVARGRLAWGVSSHDFLLSDGVPQDFRVGESEKNTQFEYIHYKVDGADVYFVCNQTEESRTADLIFRVTGRQPEFWNPAEGTVRTAHRFTIGDETTSVPMSFEPHGSMFVVFRAPADDSRDEGLNFPSWQEQQIVGGPWEVSFDPRWGGPEGPVRFDTLFSWLKHRNPQVRNYSGKAVYRTTFDLTEVEAQEPLALELGDVKDVGIARVTLNDKDLGVVWLPPFQVDISDALKPGENRLEVLVVNSWHNRVMTDEALPPEQRLTNTNIKVQRAGKFKWEPEDSGLLGPVKVLARVDDTKAAKKAMLAHVSTKASIIADIKVLDDANQAAWSVQQALRAGKKLYGDGEATITRVPEELEGADWIRTARGSRDFRGKSLLSFRVLNDADVFVGVDHLAREKPAWMTDWIDTGLNLHATEGKKQLKFNLYRRVIEPGFKTGETVRLGPNPVSAPSGYVVAVIPGQEEPVGWHVVPKILAKIKPPKFADRVFNITDYGAVGDGKTTNTEAIAKAIASCNSAGGGRVLVPEGTFLTGPVHMEDNVNLHVVGTIHFSRDPNDYLPAVPVTWEGTLIHNYTPFIYAWGKQNLAVTGTGVIDGRASDEHWWPWKHLQADAVMRTRRHNDDRTPLAERQFGHGDYLRPQLLHFIECANILVRDVTIKNSPFWTTMYTWCENVTVDNITVRSNFANNDGCNPNGTRYMVIRNCDFSTGDDGVAIKANRNYDGREADHPCSEYIVIQNCTYRANESYEYTGNCLLALGSEMAGGINQVYMENCKVSGPLSTAVVKTKSNSARGGYFSNIYTRNIDYSGVVPRVKPDGQIRLAPFYQDSRNHRNGGDEETTWPTLYHNVNIRE